MKFTETERWQIAAENLDLFKSAAMAYRELEAHMCDDLASLAILVFVRAGGEITCAVRSAIFRTVHFTAVNLMRHWWGWHFQRRPTFIDVYECDEDIDTRFTQKYPAEALSYEVPFGVRLDVDALDEALKKIRKRELEVLRQHYLEDLSLHEIARRENRPESYHGHLSRMRARAIFDLRTILLP